MNKLFIFNMIIWQLAGLTLPAYYINLMLTRDGEIHFWTSIVALTVSGQSLMIFAAYCTFTLLGDRK